MSGVHIVGNFASGQQREVVIAWTSVPTGTFASLPARYVPPPINLPKP